jgi:hypothetical protein
VTLLNTTVYANTSADGGGIYNNGLLTITASSLISNTASSRGGGLRNTDNGVALLTNVNVLTNSVTHRQRRRPVQHRRTVVVHHRQQPEQ